MRLNATVTKDFGNPHRSATCFTGLLKLRPQGKFDDGGGQEGLG